MSGAPATSTSAGTGSGRPAGGRSQPLSRRRFLGGTVAGAALLGLTACGNEPAGDAASDRPAPSRVVAFGQGADADALIALGIVPVGMSAGYQSPIYPWTAQALAGRPVEVMQTNTTVPVEQVAALRPDLIVATTYYQLDPVRERLEQIAPVVGPSGGVDKETWQTTTIRVGEAIGRADQARKLVQDTESMLASARAAHPRWQGKTFTFGPVIPGQEIYTVSATSDASAALLSALGLRLAPPVTALPASEIPGRAKISRESLDVLDADVLMLAYFGGPGTRADFEKQPLFQQIPAVRRGSYLPLPPDLSIALAFPSVLNVPYALQQLTPELDTALRG